MYDKFVVILSGYRSIIASALATRVFQVPTICEAELDDSSFADITAQLPQLVHAFEADEMTSADAVKIQYPVWRTTFFPLAVLFEAWSRTTGMPTVFYIDAFVGLLLGLLNKDIGVDVAGWQCRSRYWSVGTAQPGSGKSPAVDPMVQCLAQVMKEHHDLAPGHSWDNFHIFTPMTHCAAVDKLKTTSGYATIVAGEGGPLLCPSWPTSGTWNQATHINFARFLDSANGGAVPWQTAIDRKQKKEEVQEQVVATDSSPLEKTNVTVILFQQQSVLLNWWATSEVRNKIGLPQRCLFSFGAAREPGPPRTQNFEQAIVMPLLSRAFACMLKVLGPKAPFDATTERQWALDAEAREVFYRYRLACTDVTKTTLFGETFITGLNKASYWVSTIALFGSLMETLWGFACRRMLVCKLNLPI